MRDLKKRRLAARGWRIGGTKEFLGLTAEEESYIDLRLRLADGLRKRRIRRRLTQAALAKAVRSSQSRVAKMEAGDPTVTLDLLIRSLLVLGVSRGDLAKIISSRRTVAIG
ncbi:MAG: helix-turn-helix transcriptional regulator [Candidatus Eisenbacteria bacterium]